MAKKRRLAPNLLLLQAGCGTTLESHCSYDFGDNVCFNRDEQAD